MLTRINVTISKYTQFNSSIDKITRGFPLLNRWMTPSASHSQCIEMQEFHNHISKYHQMLCALNSLHFKQCWQFHIRFVFFFSVVLVFVSILYFLLIRLFRFCMWNDLISVAFHFSFGEFKSHIEMMRMRGKSEREEEREEKKENAERANTRRCEKTKRTDNRQRFEIIKRN